MPCAPARCSGAALRRYDVPPRCCPRLLYFILAIRTAVLPCSLLPARHRDMIGVRARRTGEEPRCRLFSPDGYGALP